MPQSIRVLLVDAPALVRSCLATVLNRRRRLQVVGEAGRGPEAIAEARTLRPDVVVVDPDVPGGGIRLISELADELPEAAVVVLTAAGAVPPPRALQAGARGYLDKDCEPGAVVTAIERVHGGELVVAPTSTDAVVRTLGAAGARGAYSRELTGRECEVLRLVASGRTNREIAAELVITEHTVKAHLAKIQSKLGLANRVRLTRYAVQNGYHDPASLGAVSDALP